MRRSLSMLFIVAGVVLALDFATKQWASRTLAGSPPVPVLGDFVRFTYARNSGVAFGLGAGLPFPYYLFSLAAVAAILYLFIRQRVGSPVRRLALALIMGGALGNLVDRVTTGQVVDFIEIGWGRWRWPVFNVADSAVSIGVVLFALTWPRRARDSEPSETPGSPDAEASTRAESEPREDREHDAGAGSLGAATRHGGAAGPLPGRGADGPLA